MAHRRTARVADLVKQEVSQIIQHEMKDPRIGFVTVTSVEPSRSVRDITDDERATSGRPPEEVWPAAVPPGSGAKAMRRTRAAAKCCA